MANSKTELTAPKSDFTTSGGVVNYAILNQELGAASLSVPVYSVMGKGTDVKIVLDGNATEADVTAVETVIAAHAGDVFQPTFQSTSEAEDVLKGEAAIEATDATLVTVYEHDSGALPEGQYQILWSAEHRVDVEADGEDSNLLVEVDLGDGNGYLEMSADSNQSQKIHSVSNGMVLPRVDGQSIKVRMSLNKTGSGGSKAILRRARLVHFPLGS